MESILKKVKANTILSSLLCAALGLVLVIWPDISMQIVCIAIGAVLILCGVIRLFGFFLNHDGSVYTQGNLVMGIVLVVVGIWIVATPGKVLAIIPIIVGILIVIHGVNNIQQTITLCKGKYPMWWLALIMALLTIGLGILLITRPFAALDTVVMLIGFFLIYDGLSNVWIVSRIAKTVKMARQEAEAVDVDARDVP
jgi:uncharacterized membrane protein HdeD (DUF308 family)